MYSNGSNGAASFLGDATGYTGNEGVLTVMPGTNEPARRYSKRSLIPANVLSAAKQIGAAGFWYVPVSAEKGVLTVVPGTTIAATRYSTKIAVPTMQRAAAKQIGAAGFWYVPEPPEVQKAFAKSVEPTKAEIAGANAQLQNGETTFPEALQWIGIGLAAVAAAYLFGGRK